MTNDHRTPAKLTNHAKPPLRPGYYIIRIKGFVDQHWDWLENLVVSHIEPGEALLRGPIPDQAALHGLLARIRDLNLTLLSVNQIDSEDHRKEEDDGYSEI